MTDTTERWNYQGRILQRRMNETLRERRRLAIRSMTHYCIKISLSDGTLQELVFDAPPTLAQLVGYVGENATVVGAASEQKSVRVQGSTDTAH